jgi:hypothetical protein
VASDPKGQLPISMPRTNAPAAGSNSRGSASLPTRSVSSPDSVSRGAPNDRAGSADAVMLTKVEPPPAIARDDLRGWLGPPRAEALPAASGR